MWGTTRSGPIGPADKQMAVRSCYTAFSSCYTTFSSVTHCDISLSCVENDTIPSVPSTDSTHAFAVRSSYEFDIVNAAKPAAAAKRALSRHSGYPLRTLLSCSEVVLSTRAAVSLCSPPLRSLSMLARSRDLLQ